MDFWCHGQSKFYSYNNIIDQEAQDGAVWCFIIPCMCAYRHAAEISMHNLTHDHNYGLCQVCKLAIEYLLLMAVCLQQAATET